MHHLTPSAFNVTIGLQISLSSSALFWLKSSMNFNEVKAHRGLARPVDVTLSRYSARLTHTHSGVGISVSFQK